MESQKEKKLYSMRIEECGEHSKIVITRGPIRVSEKVNFPYHKWCKLGIGEFVEGVGLVSEWDGDELLEWLVTRANCYMLVRRLIYEEEALQKLFGGGDCYGSDRKRGGYRIKGHGKEN